MAIFDGWEAQLYGPNTLAHFRTRGSKNGVRRFQMEDGTWTPLGLKERKEREGWGSERKARRAEKKAARAERKAASAAARRERIAAFKEEKRKNNLKTMTDEELKAKINRLKLEQEYKELNKNPALKIGEKLVTAYLDARARAEERREKQETRLMEREKIKNERERIKADVERAKQQTAQRNAEAEKAKYDKEKMEADVQGGLKIARKTDLKKAKIEWKGTTLHGAIIRRIGTALNSGIKEKKLKIRQAEGQVMADAILSAGKDANRKAEQARKAADSRADAKRYAAYNRQWQKEDTARRRKNRREYERESRRISSWS